jgi:hypothetical protein
MSRVAKAEAGAGGFVCVCANSNCGAAEVNNIKLEECTDCCQSVRYCGDKCREEHQELHSEECKKRQAELHERKLFEQPDSFYLGECPLCFLPLPIDMSKSILYSCCSKIICKGCRYTNRKNGGGKSCPFCREPQPKKGEIRKRLMKRVKANDPAALCHMGDKCFKEGDYDGALEYFSKAAELGDAGAHYRLGCMYWKGTGVERDEEKEVYHYEKAAIGGHHIARNNLGYYEEENGNMERAVKHYIIAANLGYDESMKALWKHYSQGDITKEELEATLRTHQAALDEMKSPERDAAAAAAI